MSHRALVAVAATIVGLWCVAPAHAESAAGRKDHDRLRPGQGFPGAGLEANRSRPLPRAGTPRDGSGQVAGLDVSSWQGNVDWARVHADGGRFAYVKATESVNYQNPYYSQQYHGARAAGLIRGAYHFGQPHESSGAAQADYFIAGGGGGAGDGWTLPGALDIEANPYGHINGLNACYDMSPSQMATWIRDFTNRYRQRTGRPPTIYTTTSWWRTCTGNSPEFGKSPLWLARWGAAVGELPAGWSRHTIWQHANAGTFPGDQNLFNGTYKGLRALAGGPPTDPTEPTEPGPTEPPEPTDPPAPEVNVAISGRGPGEVAAGGSARYVLTVSNTGSAAVSPAEVSGYANAKQVFTGVTGDPGCRYGLSGFTCSIGRLDPGERLRVTVTAKVAGSAEGSVTLSADVDIAEQEAKQDDNRVEIRVPIK